MKNQENFKNPWIVESLEYFLYYCCPECHLKFSCRESFLQHAINQHPLVQKCLPMLTGVKDEIDGNKEYDTNGENSDLPRGAQEFQTDVSSPVKNNTFPPWPGKKINNTTVSFQENIEENNGEENCDLPRSAQVFRTQESPVKNDKSPGKRKCPRLASKENEENLPPQNSLGSQSPGFPTKTDKFQGKFINNPGNPICIVKQDPYICSPNQKSKFLLKNDHDLENDISAVEIKPHFMDPVQIKEEETDSDNAIIENSSGGPVKNGQKCQYCKKWSNDLDRHTCKGVREAYVPCPL